MQNTSSTTKKAFALSSLFLVSVIWGGGFVAGKMALEGFPPFVILVYRFLLAALLCGVLFLRRILQTPRKTVISGIIIGGIQFLALSIQLMGLEYTTPAKQSFLCTAYVAMVPFIIWIILRSRPSFRSILAGFLALFGIGLICLSDSFTVNPGDLLSLGFSLVFGIQIVLIGKFVTENTDAIQLSFFQFLTAGLLALVISLIRGEHFFSENPEALLGMGYLALLNTFLAFLLQNLAQKHVSGSLTALILSLESVFGFLFSVLYYREPISLQILFGSLLCFAAILLNSMKPKSGVL